MSSMGKQGANARWRVLTRLLAAALVGTAAVVLGAAVWPGDPAGLAATSLALLVAATACWQIGRRLAVDPPPVDPQAEEALLRSMLSQRDGAWDALPAPAAVWDTDDQFLRASAAWRSLGLPTDVPPNQPEVLVGDMPRVFVVEASEEPSGMHLVLLREVTRERQALRAKDELLAIVGHELRTPLSSIKGYGQLMARQLATVQEQVQRLDGLIDDVMDTARAEGGRLNLRREPLSVSDLVGSACDRFVAAQPSRKLEKKLDARAIIEADPGRLNQVIDNLLSNAAKYSAPETTIRVHTVLDDVWVRIAITDAGVGIASEHLPRLFDRFYRVPSGDAAAPGFGLGLSIVRDLVDAHGGRVEVASDGPGTGCTFTVVLPFTLPLADEANQSTELTRR
jgi:signal transduction histidine kinase